MSLFGIKITVDNKTLGKFKVERLEQIDPILKELKKKFD